MVKFKYFSRPLSGFSSTFQGKFNFQGLFKTVLYIQALFKPVRTMSLTFFPSHSHPIMSSPISGTSTTTSHISTAIYSPKYPTPILRCDATKTSNVQGEERQIKINASVSEQASGKEILMNALHELTTTFKTVIDGMSKAVEDQMLYTNKLITLSGVLKMK